MFGVFVGLASLLMFVTYFALQLGLIVLIGILLFTLGHQTILHGSEREAVRKRAGAALTWLVIGAPVTGLVGVLASVLSGLPAQNLTMNLFLIIVVPAAFLVVRWVDDRLSQARTGRSTDE